MTFRDAAGAANDYAQNFNVENELSSVVNNGSTTSFTYDAAGIRVKSVKPGGKTSYFPFPGYEEEVNGSTTTRRITYAIAGQAVALRVQVVGGSNTLYYLHSDHLGSTSLSTTTGGAVVAGSTARYYPFGDWRTEPTTNLTDRGFTGHLHNNLGNAPDDIGLVYMQARWYLPYINRFISADTIVPDAKDPQSLNRYAYVRNNPLRYTDSSGHCAEEGDEECWAFAEQTANEFGIPLEFVGIMDMAQMRLFIQGLNTANEVDSGLLGQITNAINGYDSQEWGTMRWLADNSNWDILGIHIGGGGGAILGGEIGFDFVFNWDSWEVSVMGSLGGSAGMTLGGSIGGGVIFGFNAPDNSVMWDWSWGINGEAAITGGVSLQYSESIGNDAWFFSVSGLGGEELDVSIGLNYTWEIYRYMSDPSGGGYGIWWPKSFYDDGYNYGQ
ncbi:MAG: RHS repeat-associated core domain-containing protein [Chloroflexi bacterium]|nr:RHS repeat-associated core domain-containing protein [Chloroflexota bacterium]